MRNPFRMLATYIVHRLGLGNAAGTASASTAMRLPGSNEKLSRELMELGGGRKNCVESYYVNKIESFLKISALCLVVLIAVIVYEHQQDRRVENGILERPGYGEGAKEQSLILSIGAEHPNAVSREGQEDREGHESRDSQESQASRESQKSQASREDQEGRDGQEAGKEAGHAAESESFEVRIDARTYTSKQVKTLLRDAADTLAVTLPGENRTLDEVRLPLSLPAKLEDGAVSVEYYITPGGVIEEDGSICREPDPEGTLVRILATLTCQDKSSTYECTARIYPPILTEEEQLRKNIQHAVEQARSSDPTDAKVKLPDSVDGRTLHWSYPRDSSLTLIILLMLILPVAYWAREDSRIHDAAKERLSQLELDYSQLLWKLTMLLSAGLTIRGAFTRIVDQYEAERTEEEREHAARTSARTARGIRNSGAAPAARGIRNSGAAPAARGIRNSGAARTARGIRNSGTAPATRGSKNSVAVRTARNTKNSGAARTARNSRNSGAIHTAKRTGRRYVYEEMILTLREMRSGVPEASAYENFGRRCSLPAYIKLGSLLSQNLKKGSKGLTALLEHEAVLSMDQHKMAVRKLGERASVKMLLPMILMFGVVLIILMVPAFLSM